MKNIQKIKDLLGNQKEYIQDYKVTFSLLIGLTLLMTVIGFDIEVINKLYVGLIFVDILTFAIESFTQKRNNIIIAEIPTIIISALSTIQLFNKNVSLQILLLIYGFYSVVSLVTIYKVSKKYSLKEYMISVFENNMLLSIASFIVQIGLLFIISIIQSLLLNKFYSELYLRAEILFLGCFLTPGIILSLLNVREEAHKLTKKLIVWIILPLVLLSETIIYIYLTKIVILWDLPSNAIYRIVAFLFVAAYPTWVMLENFVEDNKLIKNVRNYIPYTFIPLILLQVLALGIRISGYGFTIFRYLGLYFIVFEVATIIYSLMKNKEKHNQIFVVAGILVGIVTIIPGINMIDVPLNSQLRRLKNIYPENINFEDLSNEDKRIAKSSYDYIIYSLDKKDMIPSYIDQTKLQEFYYYYYYDDNDTYSDTKYVNYSNKGLDEINIEKYSKMKLIYFYEYYDAEDKSIEAITNEFMTSLEIEGIENNFKGFIKKAIKNGEITNNLIKLNDNIDLYITEFSMSYKESTNEIESLDISGYLLTK